MLTVSDGTASDTDEVTITVTGANAAATIGGDLTGDVTEDDEDKDEASGTVTVSDSDGANTVQAQTDEAGTYGTFSIKTNGEWTYTLDNTDDDTNNLAAGSTEDDAFAIAAADGTAGTVTITVTGANDAPTVGTTIPDQAATVDTAFEYVFPSTSFSDADSDSLTYEAKQTDGTTDSALPSWLTFTAAERKLAGTPKTADIGR